MYIYYTLCIEALVFTIHDLFKKVQLSEDLSQNIELLCLVCI